MDVCPSRGSKNPWNVQEEEVQPKSRGEQTPRSYWTITLHTNGRGVFDWLSRLCINNSFQLISEGLQAAFYSALLSEKARPESKSNFGLAEQHISSGRAQSLLLSSCVCYFYASLASILPISRSSPITIIQPNGANIAGLKRPYAEYRTRVGRGESALSIGCGTGPCGNRKDSLEALSGSPLRSGQEQT